MDIAAGVYLSEAQNAIPPPPLHTVFVYTVYFYYILYVVSSPAVSGNALYQYAPHSHTPTVHPLSIAITAAAANLMYIILPMYLFFMTFRLNDF
jgi:hypothetical protein